MAFDSKRLPVVDTIFFPLSFFFSFTSQRAIIGRLLKSYQTLNTYKMFLLRFRSLTTGFLGKRGGGLLSLRDPPIVSGSVLANYKVTVIPYSLSFLAPPPPPSQHSFSFNLCLFFCSSFLFFFSGYVCIYVRIIHNPRATLNVS